MYDSIKRELHQLVDKCTNELLLKDARELLQLTNDWWDDLSEDDKSLMMYSYKQYSKGDFVTNDELLKRFEKWKNK